MLVFNIFLKNLTKHIFITNVLLVHLLEICLKYACVHTGSSPDLCSVSCCMLTRCCVFFSELNVSSVTGFIFFFTSSSSMLHLSYTVQHSRPSVMRASGGDAARDT